MRTWFCLLVLLLSLTGCTVFTRNITTTDTPGIHPTLATVNDADRVGVQFHIHEATRTDFKLAREFGVRVVRVDFVWEQVEKTRGEYSWDALDRFVEFTRDTGGRIVITLNYGNPLYEPSTVAPSAWSVETRVAWSTVVQAAVKRYGDDTVIWEIWNEPDSGGFWPPDGASPEQYYAFAASTAQAIRLIKPNACVVGGASSGVELGWNKQLLALGFADVVDGITIHPYRSLPRTPRSIVTDGDVLKLQHAIAESTTRNVPVILGEWGYGLDTTGGPTDPAEIAALFREMRDVTIEQKLPFFIWYDWRGWQSGALVGEDLLARPAFELIKNGT